MIGSIEQRAAINMTILGERDYSVSQSVLLVM